MILYIQVNHVCIGIAKARITPFQLSPLSNRAQILLLLPLFLSITLPDNNSTQMWVWGGARRTDKLRLVHKVTSNCSAYQMLDLSQVVLVAAYIGTNLIYPYTTSGVGHKK